MALIGRVGSGKSTIERLIMGLYQPTEGAVLLDGIDLRQLDPADVRRNLGYVSQDVTLFYGTLRENITFGLPYADDSAVVAAAELSGMPLHHRHPRGFDMPVGERGRSALVASARQRAARACANAPILRSTSPPRHGLHHDRRSRRARRSRTTRRGAVTTHLALRCPA